MPGFGMSKKPVSLPITVEIFPGSAYNNSSI